MNLGKGKQYHKEIISFILVVLIIAYHSKINDCFNLFRSFEGKIISKHMGSREIPCLELNDGDEFNHNITNVKIFTAIDTGDYIIKKRWSLQFTLIKNNKDTIVFE